MEKDHRDDEASDQREGLDQREVCGVDSRDLLQELRCGEHRYGQLKPGDGRTGERAHPQVDALGPV